MVFGSGNSLLLKKGRVCWNIVVRSHCWLFLKIFFLEFLMGEVAFFAPLCADIKILSKLDADLKIKGLLFGQLPFSHLHLDLFKTYILAWSTRKGIRTHPTDSGVGQKSRRWQKVTRLCCFLFLLFFLMHLILLVSNQAREPAELKHINKRRKRNQQGFP